MKRSIVKKIKVKFIGILSITLIFLGTILSIWAIKFLETQRKDELNKEIYPISLEISNYLKAQENSSLSNLQNIIDIVSNSTEANIIVTDNLGYMYAVSSNDNKSEERENKLSGKIITDEEREYLKNGNEIEKIEKGTINKYVYIKPIFQDDYFGGVLIIKVPTEFINDNITRVIITIWAVIFLAVFFVSIGIGYFTKKIIVEPINEINRVANKFAIGEVEQRVVIDSEDEIGELAKSFNILAESLNKGDINRKDFLSNVAHELRSPMTSIMGFVAGIIDGIIPKEKEKYYLSIAYDEIKRLSRLVDELLDISTLDNSSYKLNKIEVDINGLIKICLTSKETKMAEKDLKVEVLLEEDHQFVYVDRDRIIQVITNLLDNAIKYSYNGEVIKINTKVKSDKVYVSIKNKGPELSEEENIKIWNRFYKADTSRTNKDSTGLGLSIVRAILTRHGEDIWVSSENGETKFTFTLTRVL